MTEINEHSDSHLTKLTTESPAYLRGHRKVAYSLSHKTVDCVTSFRVCKTAAMRAILDASRNSMQAADEGICFQDHLSYPRVRCQKRPLNDNLSQPRRVCTFTAIQSSDRSLLPVQLPGVSRPTNDELSRSSSRASQSKEYT